MTSKLRTLLFLLLLSAIPFSGLYAYSHAADSATSPANALGQIRARGTRVAEIDSSHIRVAVDLTITPGRSVTLEDLRLLSLRLNGLPVFAEPLIQPIDLAQGKETALPPVYVTAQFRDLNTVAPIREMIEKQNVHVQGQVIAAVKMSFLEKLAMHTQHPRVSLTLAQDVPVEMQVSPLQRQAALAALAVIDFGLEQTASARKNLPGLQSPWLHELETEASKSLLEVESSYTLKEHDMSYSVALDQLGFRLASDQVIATAEASAPWEYDVEFQHRIKSGDAKLAKNGDEILLFSPSSRSAAGIADTLSLKHKDFTIHVLGNPEKDSLILQKNHAKDPDGDRKKQLTRVSIRRRATPDALSVITLQNPPSNDGFAVAPAEVRQRDNWEKVAVFRLISNTATGKDSIEVVQLSAHREGKSIQLDQPVDSSFYGSPIVTPEGVIGVVQDERAGAFLPSTM